MFYGFFYPLHYSQDSPRFSIIVYVKKMEIVLNIFFLSSPGKRRHDKIRNFCANSQVELDGSLNRLIIAGPVFLAVNKILRNFGFIWPKEYSMK